MNPLNWNTDQIQSLLRSILKMLGAVIVAKGVADQSAVEIISAGILALAGVVWSHRSNAGPPEPPATPPPAVPVWLLLAALALGLTACKTQGGYTDSRDPFVIRVEQTETIGYSTLDTFLRLDNANRGFWRTNLPPLHRFAEYLRQPVVLDVTNRFPRWAGYIYSLDLVKLNYKAGRATSNDVVTVLATVETAIGQAQQYISHANQ